MRRIIIAIPYTSIIVQTAGILKNIFGEENVLEHHSNFNPDEIINEEARDKAMLATENWDYPVIVLSGTIKGANPKAIIDGIEHVSEIIPEEYALHDRLRRVKLVIDNTGKTYDEMAAELAKHDKVLCIVKNTRSSVKPGKGLYCISTTLNERAVM